jgi:phospholipase C
MDPADNGSGSRYSRRQILAGGLGLAGAGLLAGCSSPSSPALPTATTAPAGSDLGAVEHVVFLMQENRSFDHYFGTYRGVRGFDDRSDGALGRFSQQWPDGAGGATRLLPFNLASATAQICAGNNSIPIHDWAPQHQSWDDGTNARFVAVHAEPYNDGPAEAPIVMGYFTRQQLPFYYSLADAFTICDNYHCSVLGPTMPNRLYAWSAFIDPAGTHGGPVLETPGFNTSGDAVSSVSWDTMPEVLLDRGISWKVYQPPGSSVGETIGYSLAGGFNALLYFKQYLAKPSSSLYKQAFLPSWPAEFTSDVRAGTLPQVSWLLPELALSEHPNGSPRGGEHYVSQVLSILMSNPQVWSKTVVFLTYDENGGFFDHVVPPTAPPGTAGEQVGNSVPLVRGGEGVAGPIGLGFRVPALVISPWSRGGWVDSGTYDHTSQLRFLEARFGVEIPNLTDWRRQTVGDMTSALGLGSATNGTPQLAPAPTETDPVCPSVSDAAAFLSAAEPVRVPAQQAMPSQEPGTARRR